MGHSAKYGSYTVVDLNMKKVLFMEPVQVNSVVADFFDFFKS